MWLISYPRSGNTWLRLFFETYTGQPSISEVGADGPLIHAQGKPCVYKLHHFDQSKMKADRGGKAIVILRNPLDVFVSNLKYKGIAEMEDRFLDKMWENYEQVLRDFHNYKGEKVLIYYEDLLYTFEKAIIPALRLMELKLDKDKIEAFTNDNAENYKTVNRWFKQYVNPNRLSNDMKFEDRRNTLSEQHIRMIQNKIKESPYTETLERYLC